MVTPGNRLTLTAIDHYIGVGFERDIAAALS
jgi:hypothetical protein